MTEHRAIIALRTHRRYRYSPQWAYRLSDAQDAVDRLNLWWKAHARDECINAPDWNDVLFLFEGWTDERLIEGLRYMRSLCATIAAMGARADSKFLPYLLPLRFLCLNEPRNFNKLTSDRARELAAAGCQRIDAWYGIYDLWDFLFTAAEAYRQCEIPVQRRLFA